MSESPGNRPTKKELEEAKRRTRRLAIAGTAAAVGVGAVGIYLATHEQPKPSLKETVLNFNWDKARQPTELQRFSQILAKSYIEATKSTRVTEEGLTKPEMLNFYWNREDFIAGVRSVVPGFNPDQSTATPNLHSLTDPKTSKIFVDLNSLREQNANNPQSAGLVILGDLWHEFGHADITEKTVGERINNPSYFFRSPISGKDEVFKRYHGGAVFTDTFYGFIRFEEVWNDTNTIELVKQATSLEIPGLADYQPNGTTFFLKLLRALNITPVQSYQMHANSDFEGFAKLIGEKLPGAGTPIEKGIRLFIGIHNFNSQQIEQSGALTLIK